MAGEQILVVDDNPANLKLVSFLLSSKGYDVRTAADAPEVIRMLETFHPALILMDIQLPGMDGLTLTRLLKGDPRTRDIMQVARRVWQLRHPGTADPGDAHIALTEIVIEQEDLLRALWDSCTPHQQNILRAVAADVDGLTTTASIRQFALRSTGTATNSARALMDTGRLVRADTRSGYGFDNPFFREWVRSTTLQDLGGSTPGEG